MNIYKVITMKIFLFLFIFCACVRSFATYIITLKEFAEKGDVVSQYVLGNYYCQNEDYQNAVKWWRNAADLGIAEVQYCLGVCYENGNGVEKDSQEAVKWYRKAAEQGYAVAQCNLGNCYCNGLGVEKDYQEAVKWYRKATEQGNAGAQYNLGFCYDKGRGIIQNKVKAYAWYALSSKNGDDVGNKNMKLLEKELTQFQLEEALRLAEKYDKGIFD